MNRQAMRQRQTGAALVMGLVLMMVLTLLAVSGMNTATLELTMAGNTQYAESAFQAAETGINRRLVTGIFDAANPEWLPTHAMPDSSSVDTYTQFQIQTEPPLEPGFENSIGSEFGAFHFDVVATGVAPRGATATNTQSVYVLGPSGR